jgi:hypothetical protein
VTRRARLLTSVSWLGGAASVLPFAEEWFGLSMRAGNLLLLGALATSVGLAFAVSLSSSFRRFVERLAGPRQRPARALVLVAVFATAGALAMLGGAALAGSV